MAYMSQEKKAEIAAALKKVVPDGWKYSLAVDNHSSIVFTLRQAPVDVLANIREATSLVVGTSFEVNHYYIENQFSGEVLEIMLKIKAALFEGNWDKSDIQTDYFNVGWYVHIHIGRWNAPFLDTIPAPASAPRPYKALTLPSTEAKPKFSDYAKFLPPDWAGLSPGRKAAATKAAMRKVHETA